MSVEQARAEALSKIGNKGDRDFEAGVDIERIRALCETASRLAREKRARIHLLILPWNPLTIRRLKELSLGYTIEQLNRELLENVRRACPLPIHDYENLCPEVEFFDHEHPRESCFARLMKKLRDDHVYD